MYSTSTIVFALVSLHFQSGYSVRVNENKCCGTSNIVTRANITEELEQVIITCSLNDILIIDVPVIGGRETTYLLYRPNGDVQKLNITTQIDSETEINKNETYDKGEKVRFLHKPLAKVKGTRNYKLFNLYHDKGPESSRDILSDMLRGMKGNEIMLGPLGPADHGNWLLSCIFLNDQAIWVEVSQAVVIEITERVPAKEERVVLRPGATFRPQFAYPIQDLKTCQMFAPPTSVDKAFDRDREAAKCCGFIVRNISAEDAGTWRVMAVGRIVYKCSIWLEVRDT